MRVSTFTAFTNRERHFPALKAKKPAKIQSDNFALQTQIDVFYFAHIVKFKRFLKIGSDFYAKCFHELYQKFETSVSILN